MTPLMRFFERCKSWKLWTAVVVVAAGGYYGYSAWSESASSEEQTAQTQLVPVSLGNLVNDVSVTGSIAYTTREILTFGQQGFVSDVSVSAGDAVSSGDALAALDTETIVNLDRAIAQARNNARDAEDALEQARNPNTAVQIAQAEADVANARQNLRNAEEELNELGVVSPSELAQARIDILNAHADLETTMESKAALNAPTFQDIAKARADVTAARVALNDAKDDLAAILNPVDDDDAADEIASLESDIDSAEESLTGARFDFQTARRNAEDNTGGAMDDMDTLQSEYNELFEKWLGGMDVSQMADQSPDAIFASRGIDFQNIFRKPQVQGLLSSSAQGIPLDDSATPWNEVVVFSWVNLYPGQFLVDCGDSESRTVMCVRDEFLEAFDAVHEHAANLETIQVEESEKIRKAEVAASNAESALALKRDALEDYLADLSAEPDQLLVESRERTIETAEAELLDAETALADLTLATEIDIQIADREVELAEAGLADAEDDLADLLADPDPVDMTVKQAAVRLARESLAEAETALKSIALSTSWRSNSGRPSWSRRGPHSRPQSPTSNAPRCARHSTA